MTEKQLDVILDFIFSNGIGEEADRILLVKESHSGAAGISNADYLGGYNKQALKSTLLRVFKNTDLLEEEDHA